MSSIGGRAIGRCRALVAEASTIIAEAVAAGARLSRASLQARSGHRNGARTSVTKRHKASQNVTQMKRHRTSQKRHKASQCDAGAILPIDTKNKKKIGEVSRRRHAAPALIRTGSLRRKTGRGGRRASRILKSTRRFFNFAIIGRPRAGATRSNSTGLPLGGIGSGELCQLREKKRTLAVIRMSLEDINWESIVQFKAKNWRLVEMGRT